MLCGMGAREGSVCVGGVVAGSALVSAADTVFEPWSSPGGSAWVAASSTAPAVALVLAAVVAATLTGRRNASHVAALVGTAILAFEALGAPEARWWSAAGAGLLLGALSALAGQDRAQVYLAAGTLGGIVLGPTPWQWAQAWGGAQSALRRYADYHQEQDRPPDTATLAVLVVLLGLLLLAARKGPGPTDTDSGGVRVLGAAFAVPAGALAALAVHAAATGTRWFEHNGAGLGLYTLAVAAVMVAVALWLPGRDGAVLLAAGALAATSLAAANSGTAVELSGLRALMLLALVGIGVMLGRAWPHPLVGMGVLALGAANMAANAQDFPVAVAAATFVVLPLAGAYTVASTLPTSPTLLTAAVAAPAVVVAPLVISYGWTAYAPLTDRAPELPSPLSWPVNGWMPLVAVIGYAAAWTWLSRRGGALARP